MKEIRYFSTSVRSLDGHRRIGGLAARYGVLSHDLGGFRERISKGAFREVLQGEPDVLCCLNHSASHLLGRTSSGTLSLLDTPDGLDFTCDLPNTSDGDDVLELLNRGDLRECSFAFSLEDGDDAFSNEDFENEDGERCNGIVRSIKHISSLHDVSVVASPAYPSTSVGRRSEVRNLFPEGLPKHITEKVGKVEEGLTDAERIAARRALFLR